MKIVIGSFRLVLIFFTAFVLVSAYSILLLFIKHNDKRGFLLRRIFLKLLVVFIGFKIQLEGKPVVAPALYVCNHKGVFDFFAVLRYLDAFVVSKSEMSSLPIINKGALYSGIIYVKRDSKESRSEVREAIRNALLDGKNVLIYPEGTTNPGRTTMEFKMGSFVEAARHNIPVVPIALEYMDRRDYYTNISALNMFFRSFGKIWTNCSLSFGPAFHNSDPEVLCQDTKQWIDDKLLEMQKELGHQYP